MSPSAENELYLNITILHIYIFNTAQLDYLAKIMKLEKKCFHLGTVENIWISNKYNK